MHNRGSIVGNIPPFRVSRAGRNIKENIGHCSQQAARLGPTRKDSLRTSCSLLTDTLTRILYRKRSGTDNVGLDVGLS